MRLGAARPGPRDAAGRIDWQQYDGLLGTAVDADLALIIGCDRSLVTVRRLQLGLKAVGNGYDWVSFDPLLGTMPDTVLARLIGCNRLTVYRRRLELNLATFQARNV